MEWLFALFFGFALGWMIVFVVFYQKPQITCETFPNNPQPGLFDTFHGKTCSDSFGVKNIAKNFKQCLQAEDEGQCIDEQYGYFRSSGASEEDASKALLLVLKEVYND